jgi:hypothetical protein
MAPVSSCPVAQAAAKLDTLRSLALRSSAAPAGRSSVLGLRHYSVQQTAQDALKAAAAAPSNAVRAAAQALRSAPPGLQRYLDPLRGRVALRRALSLQLEAAWERHSRKALAAGTLLLAYLMFKAMHFSAQAFVDVSESLAAVGVLGLAATGAALGSVWLYRRRLVIDPDAVYRQAMLRLNTHPGVLEVLGAPVAGSAVRASVVTGGGLKFKGLRPKLRSRRVQMIWPLRGAERRGLVSLEAKKRRGQLQVKLLAVDCPQPAALGGEQRIYVEGGPAVYSRGGVLDELRRPFLAALTSQEAAEAEEEAEEAAEERAEQLRAAFSAEEPGGGGGAPQRGMYAYERAYFAVRRWLGAGRPGRPRQQPAGE